MTARNSNRGNRPLIKFDTRKRERYLEKLRTGCGRGQAAAAANVSRSTIFNHRKADPRFAEVEADAELEAGAAVENALFTAALNGNVTAMIFYLQNRFSERWMDVRDDTILRRRLLKEAKETFADTLTDVFAAEGIDAEVIERIAERLRSA